jgi:hypothetical protein
MVIVLAIAGLAGLLFIGADLVLTERRRRRALRSYLLSSPATRS